MPVTLATFPLLFQIHGAAEMFDIVFFVVVVSVVVQGWSMPLLARWLKVDEPLSPAPPVTLELSSLRHVDGDIVDYTIDADSRASGRLVRDLLASRRCGDRDDHTGSKHHPARRKHWRIKAGDHVVVVLRPDVRPLVNNVFGHRSFDTRQCPRNLSSLCGQMSPLVSWSRFTESR